MTPEQVSIALACLTLLSNVVLGIVGFLARNAFTTLQNRVEALLASQTATEKVVAVMEVRIGGEVAQLKARLEQLERRVEAEAA